MKTLDETLENVYFDMIHSINESSKHSYQVNIVFEVAYGKVYGNISKDHEWILKNDQFRYGGTIRLVDEKKFISGFLAATGVEIVASSLECISSKDVVFNMSFETRSTRMSDMNWRYFIENAAIETDLEIVDASKHRS